jgi:acyl carrier protein
VLSLTFNMPADEVTPSTVQTDVPTWDSIGHLNLMLALEDRFGITLDVDDMMALTTVAAILGFLESECHSS